MWQVGCCHLLCNANHMVTRSVCSLKCSSMFFKRSGLRRAVRVCRSAELGLAGTAAQARLVRLEGCSEGLGGRRPQRLH